LWYMKNKNKLMAFDYKTKQWVDGEDARLILIDQVNEEIEILESDKCDEYVKSFQFKCDIDFKLKLANKSLFELQS